MSTKTTPTPRQSPVGERKDFPFDTKYSSDNTTVDIVHLPSDVTLLSFGADNAESAENTRDWANSCARLSATKLTNMIEAETDVAKVKILESIFKITAKRLPAAPSFKETTKGRDSYNSAARQSFKADNVTDKDKIILEAVEKIVGNSQIATSQSVADATGLGVNQVAGAVSVLLGKGIISTTKTKHEGKAVRKIDIVMDWRNLTPRPPKTPKEKPPKVEKPPKARKPKKSDAAESTETNDGTTGNPDLDPNVGQA